MIAQDCKIKMTVDNLSMDKVKLLSEQVDLKFWLKVLISSRKKHVEFVSINLVLRMTVFSTLIIFQ